MGNIGKPKDYQEFCCGHLVEKSSTAWILAFLTWEGPAGILAIPDLGSAINFLRRPGTTGPL